MYKFSLNTPFKSLSKDIKNVILFGDSTEKSEQKEKFEGVIQNLKRRWKDTDSDFTRAEIEKYMIIKVCSECGGRRLKKEALAVKIGQENIATIVERTAEDAEKFFKDFISLNLAFPSLVKKILCSLFSA